MAVNLGLAMVSLALGKLAQKLLKEDPETPLVDEKPSSRSTRGTFVPNLIGTRLVGPFIAWVGNETVIKESQSSGGKGASGGAVEQDTWFEDGVHYLAIGPARALHKIRVNGRGIIFNNGQPIDSINHPSGTTISTEEHGDFDIYWGERLQPVNIWAGHTSRIGVESRWPFMVSVNWRQHRLGGFKVWGAIEYELEVHPFGTTLVQSTAWMDNGLGAANDSNQILDVRNSALVGDPTNFPYFKISTDRTLDYPTGAYAIVKGQLDPLVNKIWIIEQSNYDDAETYRFVSGNFTPVQAGVAEPDITLWTENDPPNITVTKLASEPDTEYPDGFTSLNGPIYDCANTIDDFSSAAILTTNCVDQGNGEDEFSVGAQRLVFYIRGLHDDENWLPHIDIGYGVVGTALADSSYCRFEYISGLYNITNNQGSIGTVSGAGGLNWIKVTITFKTGADDDQSIDSTDGRQLFLRWIAAGSFNTDNFRIFFPVAPSYLKEDPGTLLQGITTIRLDDPLTGAIPDLGTIDYLVEGNGPSGANPAHALDQLLFETFPHGAGISRDAWDMDTLEALGVQAEAEGARTHVLADLGKSAEGVIAEILQDMHWYIAWDIRKGKWIFGSMRDETGNTLPTIPEDIILLNQIGYETIHQPRIPNEVVFAFKNRDLNYRVDTRPLDDDARAGIINNRILETIEIPTATDFFHAETVAERRQLEVLVPSNAYNIPAHKEANYIVPGTTAVPENFTEPVRITDVEYNPTTRKTTLKGLTDVFTVQSTSIVSPPGMPEFGQDDPLPPLADLSQDIWELPLFLSNNTTAIMVPRVRAHGAINRATMWISGDDITYRKVMSNVPYMSGATLLNDLVRDTPVHVPDGTFPLIEEIGEDILHTIQTLDDTRWREGRQIMLINKEIMYLKRLSPEGGGVYRPEGVIRARLGTAKASHTAGNKNVYIFPDSAIYRVSDTIISPGNTLYVKLVPAGLGLADITAISTTIKGEGIRPLQPKTLISGRHGDFYKTGQDIFLSWAYYHRDAFQARNGAGFQHKGEKLEEPVDIVGRFRIIIKDGTTVLRTAEVTANRYTYSNANLVSDTGGPEPDIKFEVYHIYNGYLSVPALLTVTKL